jgi:CHAT domain-containing protein/tetratricopeptide (TPR) repeat protein
MKSKLFHIVLLLQVSAMGFTAQQSGSGDVFVQKAYRYQEDNAYDSAAMAFENAAMAFKSSGEFTKYAEAVAGINRNYLKTDRVDSVYDRAEEVLALAAQGNVDGHSLYVAETHRHLARYHWYARGSYPEALEHLHAALEIYKVQNSPHYEALISVYTDYGYTYGYAGDFEKSTDAFQKSLQMTIDLHGEEYENLGDKYTDLCFSYVKKSEWEMAESVMKKAIELNIRHHGPEHISVLKCYNNLGFIYLEKFDSDQAIIYINKAIELIRNKFGEQHRSVGIGYMNLGASYYNKKDYGQALHYGELAVAHLRASIGENNPYLGIIYRNIANAQNHLGNPDAALAQHQKALELNRALYGEKHPEVVKSYQYLAGFHLEAKNYAIFHRYNTRAIELASEILPEKHKVAAENFLQQGACFRETGKLQKSLTSLQKALYALAPSWEGRDSEPHPGPEDVLSLRIYVDVLIEMSQAWHQRYEVTGDETYLQAAAEQIVYTDRAIDVLRADLQSPAAKEMLAAKATQFYEHAIAVAFAQHQKRPKEMLLNNVLQYMEKAKSMLLLETMESDGSTVSYGIPDSLRIREQSLKQGMRFYQERIHEAMVQEDSAGRVLYENNFFEKKRDYDILMERLADRFPQYAGRHKSIQTVGITDIRQGLEPYGAYIGYFIGQKWGYTMFVSAAESRVFRFDTEGLQELLHNYMLSIRNNKTAAETAHRLYTILLEPLSETMSAHAVDHVVIAPDGLLHYIPFEALICEDPDRSGKNHYLLERFTIWYAHTTAQFGEIVKRPKSTYLGFAPTYNVDANPLLATRSAEDRRIAAGLTKLPMAVEEVKAAARMLRGNWMTGKQASEAAFKTMAPEARIIHLASHAIINDEQPMFSKLVFSMDEDSTEDGLLHTYELYNMQLDAELACLSACNTGFGRIRSGEGVMSLARGFMYAGVPNIMMSLWSVPDRSTARIMQYFYEALQSGDGKADALRAAKIRYLNEADVNTDNPYFWAALTLVGDNRPVGIHQGWRTIYWYAGLAALLAVAVLLFYRFRQ